VNPYGEPPANGRQAWPAKPTKARPAPETTAFDSPTELHGQVAPPAPPASPWGPPVPGGPPPATPPPLATSAPPPMTPPPMTPPVPAPTEPTAAVPGRSRRGTLLLVSGLVAALLVGTFVIVLVLRPGGGTTTAGDNLGPTATVDTSGLANAEQPVVASDSLSPSAAPSASRRPSPSAKPSAAPTRARDDFTAAALDRTLWSVYGTASGSSYSSDMVRVQAGELQILGEGNNPTAAANKSGGLCWCVNGNHRYGSWQVRAKFDAGSGYRQVITLWPQSDNATTDGSINFGSDSDAAKKALGVVLQPPAGAARATGSLAGDFTAWHVYRVDWRPTYVRVYVDNALIYDSSTGASPVAVPSAPMHLVLQQDKGPGNGIPAANAQTPNPVIMHIDWVQYDP